MMGQGRCNLQEKFFQRQPYPAVRDLWYRLGYAKPLFRWWVWPNGEKGGLEVFLLDERDGLVKREMKVIEGRSLDGFVLRFGSKRLEPLVVQGHFA